MSSAVAVLWILTLVVAYLAVPLLVVLLWRIVRASQKINAYSRETRLASSGISRHLDALPALDRTEELLKSAHGVGGDLALGAEAMAGLLSRRAQGRS